MRLAIAAVLYAFLSAASFAQVTFDRLRHSEMEPGNWLTYSGNFQGHRFSPLGEITAANVPNLKVKWAFGIPNSFPDLKRFRSISAKRLQYR